VIRTAQHVHKEEKHGACCAGLSRNFWIFPSVRAWKVAQAAARLLFTFDMLSISNHIVDYNKPVAALLHVP
jgi:hypothetical protein